MHVPHRILIGINGNFASSCPALSRRACACFACSPIIPLSLCATHPGANRAISHRTRSVQFSSCCIPARVGDLHECDSLSASPFRSRKNAAIKFATFMHEREKEHAESENSRRLFGRVADERSQCSAEEQPTSEGKQPRLRLLSARHCHVKAKSLKRAPSQRWTETCSRASRCVPAAIYPVLVTRFPPVQRPEISEKRSAVRGNRETAS